MKVTLTLLVLAVLQTRAPTGKYCGPDAGLLLSSPITFQVSGVAVSAASATTGATSDSAKARIPASERTLNKVCLILMFVADGAAGDGASFPGPDAPVTLS